MDLNYGIQESCVYRSCSICCDLPPIKNCLHLSCCLSSVLFWMVITQFSGQMQFSVLCHVLGQINWRIQFCYLNESCNACSVDVRNDIFCCVMWCRIRGIELLIYAAFIGRLSVICLMLFGVGSQRRKRMCDSWIIIHVIWVWASVYSGDATSECN